MTSKQKLLLAYGSQTGNAQSVSELLYDEIKSFPGIQCDFMPLDLFWKNDKEVQFRSGLTLLGVLRFQFMFRIGCMSCPCCEALIAFLIHNLRIIPDSSSWTAWRLTT